MNKMKTKPKKLMTCRDASAFFTDMVLKGFGTYEVVIYGNDDRYNLIPLKTHLVDEESHSVRLTILETEDAD